MKISLRHAIAAAAVAFCMSGTALAQPSDWCKSKWGPNDEIGAANLLTPQLAAAAAKLVTTGKTYALGVETGPSTPPFGTRTWRVVVTQPGQAAGRTVGPTKTTSNDDLYMGNVGTGSQLDGLGHVGVDGIHFNCFKSAEFSQPDGLRKLGIEKVPPMVTRGVVLDMTAILGGPTVKEGTAFNTKEIDEAAKRQGIEIRKGDVVLFHTGWQDLVGKDNKRFVAGEPGLGKDGALYLASKEVIAVGADTWGLDVIPFEPGAGVFEIHQILLARNGIYILENMNTGPLVKDGVSEFMFVLGQSRITGGVQAIVNPVAIK